MKKILYGNFLQQFEIIEGYEEGNPGKILKFYDKSSAFLFLTDLWQRNHSNQITLREFLFRREQACFEDCIVLERLSWELVSGSIQIKSIEKLRTGQSLILSFDDGPAPEDALISILDTLEKNAIKAEFYVLGEKVKGYPHLAKMIVSKGHQIQNHSWSHKDLKTATEQEIKSELQQTQDIIKQTTGIVATKVRPPYGAGGWTNQLDPELSKVAKSLSLTIQNWDIDTEDWKTPRGIGSEKLKNIKEQLSANKNKSILNVLMHVNSETARDLNTFISTLKEWSFTFADPSK